MTDDQRKEIVQAFAQLDQVVGAIEMKVQTALALNTKLEAVKVLVNKYALETANATPAG